MMIESKILFRKQSQDKREISDLVKFSQRGERQYCLQFM